MAAFGRDFRAGLVGLALGLALASPASSALPRDRGFERYGELWSYLEQVSEERRVIQAACRSISGKLASVRFEQCRRSPMQPSGSRSVQGKPLLVAEYPPADERRSLGRVLLLGGIHGDELSSVSIVFHWMEILNRFHSGMFHWRVVPLLNPDGLLRDSSQRQNERGVDLNRNFPTPNWLEEAPAYWIDRTYRNPRRYPGPAPVSEPESRYLVEEIERFRPAAIVAVHAPHSIVDFDGPTQPPERLGPLMLTQLGTYPGSLGRYAGVHMRLPVVTIELPSAGSMPTEEEERRIWRDLVSWLKKRLPEVSGPMPEVVASGSAF